MKQRRTCYNCGQHSGGSGSRLSVQRRPSLHDAPASSVPFVDTHCHLDLLMQKAHCQTYGELVRKHPMPPNYAGCIATFCDPAGLSESLGLSGDLLREPSVWGAVGIHPHSARYYDDRIEARVLDLHRNPRTVAWGEIGLDFNRNVSEPDVQKRVFARQLTLAVQLKKPIIVHSRDAPEETFETLRSNVPPDHVIDLHCFSDGPTDAARYCRTFSNLRFGVTAGAIAGRSRISRTLTECLESNAIPLDRVLLETDAPYMSAEGERFSTPAYALDAAVVVARIVGRSLDDVLGLAREGTTKAFGL
eukprot:m51a1_g13831 putative deoxyribonuclease tatdn2 (304) ;mRNA; f:487341-488906